MIAEENPAIPTDISLKAYHGAFPVSAMGAKAVIWKNKISLYYLFTVIDPGMKIKIFVFCYLLSK